MDDSRPQPPVNTSHSEYPFGRFLLANPGMPLEALPDDVDLDKSMELIRPGGHVILRNEPDGPPVHYLSPMTDPRMKWFAAGTDAAELGPRDRAQRVAAPTVAVDKIEIDTAHVHVHASRVNASTRRGHPRRRKEHRR